MKNLSRNIIVAILLCGQFLFAQERKVENLPKYYSQWLHFGAYLGVNSANFVIDSHENFFTNDTIKIIESTPNTGFNLGIVSDIKIHEYLSIRFVPCLAFSQRNLEYYFVKPDTILRVKKIESTFIDLPLDLKLRSARMNNVGVYLVGGGKFVIDLVSQKDTKNSTNLSEAIVKLKKYDWAAHGGAGIEFYLPYFKFAIEGKLSLGMRNLLVQDESILSRSLNSLRSKMFLVSFTFEG